MKIITKINIPLSYSIGGMSLNDGSKFLHGEKFNNSIDLWFESDQSQILVARTYQVLATGWYVPMNQTHLVTIVDNITGSSYHVYVYA